MGSQTEGDLRGFHLSSKFMSSFRISRMSFFRLKNLAPANQPGTAACIQKPLPSSRFRDQQVSSTRLKDKRKRQRRSANLGQAFSQFVLISLRRAWGVRIKLVLVGGARGPDGWNKENRFTGWTDVDLSQRGREEALEAGELLKSNGYSFDCAFTSVLKRAIRTLWIVLDELVLMWIPVYKSWRLNERHYGALQGLNKAETAKRYGDEQVHLWRRSYDISPPALTKDDKRHPAHDPRNKDLPESDLRSPKAWKIQ
jgi:hypothetical protein